MARAHPTRTCARPDCGFTGAHQWKQTTDKNGYVCAKTAECMRWAGFQPYGTGGSSGKRQATVEDLAMGRPVPAATTRKVPPILEAIYQIKAQRCAPIIILTLVIVTGVAFCGRHCSADFSSASSCEQLLQSRRNLLKYDKSECVEYAVYGFYKYNDDDEGGRDTFWVGMRYLYAQAALEDDEIDAALDVYEDDLKVARAEAKADIIIARARAAEAAEAPASA